jgi:hypothetical protein
MQDKNKGLNKIKNKTYKNLYDSSNSIIFIDKYKKIY